MLDEGAPKQSATIRRVTIQREVPAARLDGPASEEGFGEPRWPPVVALVVFIALNVAVRIWLPWESPVRVPWLIPTVEALLLVALVVGNPAHHVKSRSWARSVNVTLVVLLVVAALWGTTLLVYDLIRGSGVSNDPGELLALGGLVWLGNNVSFGFLYWLLDSGGPVTRLHDPRPRDFAFTQQLSPELAPQGWRPVFLDYLHLGFTNATAFSPTDGMPLSNRAKYIMLLQATVALALFGLIVARAVNAFT